MAKHKELLLLESVENLGIVGDVVRVKSGFARNYLLPMGLAEPPHPAKIEALKEARAHAQAERSALRQVRVKLVEELKGAEASIERSCNDQGALYGSVTQRDIADALQEAGFGVDVRAVRMSHPIRRIGVYTVPIQFDKDLRAEVTMKITADHALEGYTETGEAIAAEGEEEALTVETGKEEVSWIDKLAAAGDRPKRKKMKKKDWDAERERRRTRNRDRDKDFLDL